MNPDFLEKYDCTLTVKTPVFVGSGKRLSKIEYIYEPGNGPGTGTLRVIDLRKLYEYMASKGKEMALEEYFSKPGNYDMRAFLHNNQIWRDEYEKFAYTLGNFSLPGDSARQQPSSRSTWTGQRWNSAQSQKPRRQGKIKTYEILEFMSDPYGNPYVPGSTIKGMLRTALAASRIVHDADLKKNIASLLSSSDGKNNNYLANEIALAETKIFNNLGYDCQKQSNAVNSEMRLIKVSDSEPLSSENLMICQKFDERTDGTGNPLPIFKICLKPGTQIKFSVTLEKSGYGTPSRKQLCSFDDIVRSLRDFDKLYVNKFLNQFKEQVEPTDEVRCWLGSAGFHSKTILTAVYDKENDLFKKTKDIFRNTINSKNDTFKENKYDCDGKECSVYPNMRKKANEAGADFGETVLTFSKKAI